MTKKWFYTAQAEAMNELYKRFDNCLCNYQMIDSDKVIESFNCYSSKKDTPTFILLQIVRHGSDTNISCHIAEMNFIQSWKGISNKEANNVTQH